MTELYGAHYRFLVRLAVLLGQDAETAEEVVQDSFAATCAYLHPMQNTEHALNYLLADVLTRSRWHTRRGIADRADRKHAPAIPVTENGDLAALPRSDIMAALRKLPVRQREALVLRYYGNLSQEQVATTMGVTVGAADRLASRAMAALRSALERAS